MTSTTPPEPGATRELPVPPVRIVSAAAPLSLQAHLNGPDGTVEVADGLGFTSDQWRPGDWFIQRHLFATPGDTLNTGLYNYATLERVGPTITLTAE